MEKSNDKAAFLGKVTASVTHEIQNVLAIIKETSGLMEDLFLMSQSGGVQDIEDRLDKCIKTIKKQTYRGVNLTSGLNEFAHTPDSSQASINIFETIKKIIVITERLFKQKGVDVSINEGAKPCSVITDPVLFQMAVFSCIECLIAGFQPKTAPITVDIQSSENRIAILFSYHDDTVNATDYPQTILHCTQWAQITNLCEQIHLTVEITTDSPGILLSFK